MFTFKNQTFITPYNCLISFLKRFYLLILQRGEGREKHREGNINVWLPLMRPLLGTWPCNPGMCPHWESNWQWFGSQAGAQSTEPHQLGLHSYLQQRKDRCSADHVLAETPAGPVRTVQWQPRHTPPLRAQPCCYLSGPWGTHQAACSTSQQARTAATAGPSVPRSSADSINTYVHRPLP